MLFNIANVLTYTRLLITPVMIYFFFDNALISHRVLSMLVAIFLFTLGSLTDYYDGYFARKYNLSSRFGEFLDPLVDKFFTLGVFISFAFISHIVVFNTLLFFIVFRELLITLLRIVFLTKNKSMRTERHGKIKTIVQITAQSCILLLLLHNAILFESPTFKLFLDANRVLDINNSLIIQCYQFFSYPRYLAETLYWMPNVLLAIAAYVTLKSGIDYLKNNWDLVYSDFWNKS